MKTKMNTWTHGTRAEKTEKRAEKLPYTSPELSLVMMVASDIITTSLETGENELPFRPLESGSQMIDDLDIRIR